MKIVSGFLKGRNIEGYRLEGTRPTMDRIKESLFSMIQEEIENCICLDLFSGSGNLGLEAISRKAMMVYFNDINKSAVQIIKKNVNTFDISNHSVVLNKNYKSALQELKTIKFDVIFLDPPYDTDYIKRSIDMIEEYQMINLYGLIICESNRLDQIVYSKNFVEFKRRRYGDKWVVILRKI
ncbi:MAG: 16S rRNA (guanine(966)-N(2))-methyltransferase RsmD [Bacilli bacterium]|nr:16S rRNA (guanine(966)-N(2))-methyltransferase RsmD [Bacilli bacterium]